MSRTKYVVREQYPSGWHDGMRTDDWDEAAAEVERAIKTRGRMAYVACSGELAVEHLPTAASAKADLGGACLALGSGIVWLGCLAFFFDRELAGPIMVSGGTIGLLAALISRRRK
jgi:hypothetical protein